MLPRKRSTRENGGRNLCQPSSEYPLHRVYVFIQHGWGKILFNSFSLSPLVPSRGASMAFFYLSRPTGERASFELPSLTPGSPDITSTFLDRILWSTPFRSPRLQAQSNPRHRSLSKNFPLASLTEEGRKNSNPFGFSYLVGQKGPTEHGQSLLPSFARLTDESRVSTSREGSGSHDSRRLDARRIFDCVRSSVKRSLIQPN